MLCNYCNNEALLVSGKEVYPHRPDLYRKRFYLCSPCNAYVGCHMNTTIPLGSLANENLRKIRRQAHDMFDPLWKTSLITRKKAYKLLASHLSISPSDCHIASFNEDLCNEVIKWAKEHRQWNNT